VKEPSAPKGPSRRPERHINGSQRVLSPWGGSVSLRSTPGRGNIISVALSRLV